jgi:hypothetical protein
MVYYAFTIAALVAAAASAPVQESAQLERRTFGQASGSGSADVIGGFMGKPAAAAVGSVDGMFGGLSGNGKGAASTGAQASAGVGAQGSAGVHADASLAANVVVGLEAKLPSVCVGVQARLQAGAGVRIAFKAEVKAQVGLDLTDADVMAIIKGIASVGASLNVDAEVKADAGVSGAVYGSSSAQFSAGLDAMVSACGTIKGSVDTDAEFGLGALFGGLLTAGVSGAVDGSISLSGNAGAQFSAALSASVEASASVSGTAGVGALLCGLKQIGLNFNGQASSEISAFFHTGFGAGWHQRA